MLAFHALLFPAPPEDAASHTIQMHAKSWQALTISQPELHRGWFQSWEESMARLEALPRMHCEPDGSFTWTTDQGRIAGVLYDRDGKMCYAELFGNCSNAALDMLLVACGAPEQAFVFQLPREGITLTDEDFRRFAAENEV